MRKLFFLFLIIPFMGLSQNKNVISTNRVFPKQGKTVEFEKALAEHVKKYHNGDWSWRVFEVVSGPDAGGYHITEGPNTWTTFDSRGEISTEHQNHWRTVVLPLTDEARASSGYSVYQADLSTIGLSDWADKISITHLYQKPGCYGDIRSNLKKAKKVWEANGETVAVYTSHFSGEPQFALVYRHKNGWKEKEEGYRKPFPEVYDTVFGEGEFDDYTDAWKECVDHTSGEMLEYRKELSTSTQ